MEHSDEYLRAVENLYEWQYGDPTSFSSRLYALFHKADPVNRRKLSKAYPFEAAAYEEWYNYPSPDDFFREYNLT